MSIRLGKVQLWWWGWLLALIIAALIRLPHFGEIPLGLNRDEAGLAYNAYSLGRIGTDEYGQRWPVSITSFGDQKLPGYVYTLLPFVSLLGLEPWVVRLPSLLAGGAIITLVGLFINQLGTDWFARSAKSTVTWLSITAMILVAISPWGNHFSRVAYEAHLALAFYLAGWICYLRSRGKTVGLNWWLTSLTWAWAMLTYHSYHIVVPLTAVGLLLIDRQAIVTHSRKERSALVGSLIIAVTAILLMFFGQVWQANQQKSLGITPFATLSLQRAASIYRQALSPEGGLHTKLFANRLTEASVTLANNLANLISGDFLWVHGTGQSDHNPGQLANLHLFTMPFVLIGLGVLWEKRHQRASQYVALWLLASWLAPSLTIQPQHTTRFSPAFAVLEIIAALGLITIRAGLKNRWQQRLFTGGMVVIMIWSVSRLWLQYVIIIPQTENIHEPEHLLGQTLHRYSQTNPEVITQSPSSSPYIWYLLESHFDPAHLQEAIERYPADKEGFIHVKRINNLHFETITWGDLETRATKNPLILVFKPQEVPTEWRMSDKLELLESVADHRGQLRYEVWKMN